MKLDHLHRCMCPQPLPGVPFDRDAVNGGMPYPDVAALVAASASFPRDRMVVGVVLVGHHPVAFVVWWWEAPPVPDWFGWKPAWCVRVSVVDDGDPLPGLIRGVSGDDAGELLADAAKFVVDEVGVDLDMKAMERRAYGHG